MLSFWGPCLGVPLPLPIIYERGLSLADTLVRGPAEKQKGLVYVSLKSLIVLDTEVLFFCFLFFRFFHFVVGIFNFFLVYLEK